MSISLTVTRFTLTRFSLQLHANIANGRRETAEANECKQRARPLLNANQRLPFPENGPFSTGPTGDRDRER